MLVVGLDLESTGLDKIQDRPIETAMVLWSTNYNRGLDSRALLIQSDGVPVTPDITEINGITQEMCDALGYSPADAYDESIRYIDRADAIVAFNGRRFDIPMCNSWANRLATKFPDKLIIDPFQDLPMKGQELITMCAKKRIYYNPHEALADVGAMLELMGKFDFETVLMRAKSPVVVVQSLQSQKENKKAKKHKFRWNPDEKIWWKAVKQMDIDELARKVNGEFKMQIRDDFTPEDLDTDD